MKSLILALLFASSARAATYYVTQSGAGSANGTTLGNAWSVANFNSATLAGDDIVSLNGTLTSSLIVPSSGTSGHPITLLFAAGAKMSTGMWSNSTGAIQVFNHDYITIDGGATGTIGGYGAAGTTNGIIENTANGTGLANHAPSRGIQGVNANGFTVKNLWVKNIYVRTSDTDLNDDDSSGISNKAASSEVIAGYTVTNCLIDNCYRGIEGDYGVGCSSYTFSYVTASKCNWGVGVGDRGAGKTLNGITCHHCYFYDWSNWNDPSTNIYHHNGIFFFSNYDTAVITNPLVYACRFGPGFQGAYQTGAIYMNTGILNPIIYNSVFVCNATEYAANGMIVLSSTSPTTFGIYNNTFIGGGNGEAVHLYGSGNGSSQTMNVKNNIGVGNGGGTFISLYANPNVTLASDYNLAYGFSSSLTYNYSTTGSGNFQTQSQWNALGFDSHGSTANPSLSGSYVPQSGSPAIDSGVSVSATFTVDIIGTSRPQGSAWDMGAYEFQSGGSPPVFTVQPVGGTINVGDSITFSIAATGATSYQWQKNSADISGATSTSYSISSAITGDAGTYRCVASNTSGSTNSTGAVLTVNSGSAATVGRRGRRATITGPY